MKAGTIINRITAFMMSLTLLGGNILPVMASGTEGETVLIDEADASYESVTEDTDTDADLDSGSDKEVIEMSAELFNIGTGDAEEELPPANSSAPKTESGYSLGGLEADGFDSLANAVDQSISYATVMENVTDGGSFSSIASTVKPGGAEAVDAAFPYASTETDKIKEYFDENYPKCRDQNPYGTCWAHSTLAAAEFYLIAHDKADKSVDTSELALSYWTSYQGTAGPAGDNGNTVKRRYAKDANNNFLQSGGNSKTAAMTLFQQRGITAESVVPYSNAANVLESEKIDIALERNDEYYVTEYQEYDVKNNPKLVKEGIIENGGLSMAFAWYNNAYNSTYNSYYMDEKVSLNHFVTVVGWDDNFPKSNFKGAKYGGTPTSNGAWLIRNSWNEDDSNAEMNYTDYFWMSYEDKSLINVAGFKAAPKSEYDYTNCYYYDTQVYGPEWYNSNPTAANIYKTSVCDGGEILSAVVFSMFDLSSTGTKYTVEVYRDIPDGGNPTSGKKVEEATTTGTLYLGGTYTIPLKADVTLEGGENFAIVVTRDDYKSVAYATDFNWSGWNLMSDMKALPGQSWYKSGSTWKDNSDKGNFIIHALTNNIGPYVKVSSKSLKLDEDGEATLTAEAFDGDNNKIPSATFTWASDKPEVATVENGKVKAVALGTATITATYNNLKGKCVVTVGPEGVTSIDKNFGTCAVNGTETQLTATVRYANIIDYQARKINVVNDLKGEVTSSSLYDIAKSLSTTGNVSKDVIKWKFVAKKNKNAGTAAYFCLKASVAKKSVTSSMGITGKNLKQLKKAVSAFNKAAKSAENRIGFTINKLNALEMLNSRTMIPIVKRNKFTQAFMGFSHFRARTNPEKQPEYSQSFDYKKWTKISNKEFTIQKRGTRYIYTPKNKNITGNAFYIDF